jgi:predicted tellurium resistance membrane protein TerC
MLELLIDPNAWAALVTLTALEIVLGIDNVVFVAILVSRSPPKHARLARRVGLSFALIFRIAMLFGLTWLMKLSYPLGSVLGMEITWRDVILIGGGLFLIAKATHEIHREVDIDDAPPKSVAAVQSITLVISQLVAMDLVFSFDSIVTAIGMVQDIEIMITAVVIAMIVMYIATGPVSDFIGEHPTTKMLALAFMLLIGVALVADGFEFHIPRGYIYFAMAFAGLVETFNVLVRRNRRARRNRRSGQQGR